MRKVWLTEKLEIDSITASSAEVEGLMAFAAPSQVGGHQLLFRGWVDNPSFPMAGGRRVYSACCHPWLRSLRPVEKLY